MAKSTGVGGQAGEAAPTGDSTVSAVATPAAPEKPSGNSVLTDPVSGQRTTKTVAKELAACCRRSPMAQEHASEAKRLNSALHRLVGGTSAELGAAVRKFYTEPTAENGETVAKLADEIAKAK